MSEPVPIQVGIGLIARQGSYLIRRRPPLPGSPMPGFWEFPGGKCEPGEDPQAAAIRECREEAGLEVRALGLRQARTHSYPHGLIQLHYYDCECLDSRTEPTTGSGFRWVPARELLELDFPEANGPILEELAAEGSIPPRPALD